MKWKRSHIRQVDRLCRWRIRSRSRRFREPSRRSQRRHDTLTMRLIGALASTASRVCIASQGRPQTVAAAWKTRGGWCAAGGREVDRPGSLEGAPSGGDEVLGADTGLDRADDDDRLTVGASESGAQYPAPRSSYGRWLPQSTRNFRRRSVRENGWTHYRSERITSRRTSPWPRWSSAPNGLSRGTYRSVIRLGRRPRWRHLPVATWKTRSPFTTEALDRFRSGPLTAATTSASARGAIERDIHLPSDLEAGADISCQFQTGHTAWKKSAFRFSYCR